MLCECMYVCVFLCESLRLGVCVVRGRVVLRAFTHLPAHLCDSVQAVQLINYIQLLDNGIYCDKASQVYH